MRSLNNSPDDIKIAPNLFKHNLITNFIDKYVNDPLKIVELIKKEERRSQATLHLTANENILSKLSQSLLSTPLSFRYHLGTSFDHTFGKFAKKGSLIFKGLPDLYVLESLAQSLAQNIFQAGVVDFRPLSGVHAITCTLATTTQPGDLIFSINPIDGGHFVTEKLIQSLGRRSTFIDFNRDTMKLDLNSLQKALKIERPKALIFDHGATLFEFPLKEVREILGADVKIIFDASHTLGLMAGGAFQNPLSLGCDILQGNTHKSFPGPQKALIAFKDSNYGNEISAEIGNRMVSSQHTHHALALYITLAEMYKHGSTYSHQIVTNARSLSQSLEDYGFSVSNSQGEYTQTHMILVKMKNEAEAQKACQLLHECQISTNARPIFNKPFIRIGVQEVTRLGMKTAEMQYIASLFNRILNKKQGLGTIAKEVMNFINKYKIVYYSFDNILGSEESFPIFPVSNGQQSNGYHHGKESLL